MENSDVSGCLMFGLIIVVSIVVGALVYIGGGWIAHDIYRSFVPIEMTDTLKSIELTKLLVYGIVALVYSVVLYFIFDVEQYKWYFEVSVVPLGAWLVFKSFLPISLGASVLSLIVCVGACAYITYCAIMDLLRVLNN